MTYQTSYTTPTVADPTTNMSQYYSDVLSTPYFDFNSSAFNTAPAADTAANVASQYLNPQEAQLYIPNPYEKGGRVGFENGGATSFQDVITDKGKAVFDRLLSMGMNEQQAMQRMSEMAQSGMYDLGNIVGMEQFANPPRQEKMHGGMMIMGDDGVVNNGIGGILSKYKEIRSEL